MLLTGLMLVIVLLYEAYVKRSTAGLPPHQQPPTDWSTKEWREQPRDQK